MNNLSCPRCGLSQIKRNGHTHYGKQNYQCKNCARQFVEVSQQISEAERDLIRELLLERLSLLSHLPRDEDQPALAVDLHWRVV